MEQNPPGDPGRTADSAAETGRYITLKAVIGDTVIINLKPLVTDKEILRHPNCIWHDAPSDTVAPLLAAASIIDPETEQKILVLIKDNKTPNGNVISPGLWAERRRIEGKKLLWASDLVILGQALLFKLPYRWSDSKKTFEKTSGSSADYLNYINYIALAKVKDKKLNLVLKLALKLTGKANILEKIQSYYKPEPNSQWILDLYKKVIEEL